MMRLALLFVLIATPAFAEADRGASFGGPTNGDGSSPGAAYQGYTPSGATYGDPYGPATPSDPSSGVGVGVNGWTGGGNPVNDGSTGSLW